MLGVLVWVLGSLEGEFLGGFVGLLVVDFLGVGCLEGSGLGVWVGYILGFPEYSLIVMGEGCAHSAR